MGNTCAEPDAKGVHDVFRVMKVTRQDLPGNLVAACAGTRFSQLDADLQSRESSLFALVNEDGIRGLYSQIGFDLRRQSS